MSVGRINPYYDSSKHQGFALIFNHEEFDDASANRPGSRRDELALVKFCKKFHIGVKVERNKTRHEVMAVATSATSFDNSRCHCVVVVVLSHGENDGVIYARDTKYKLNDLIEIFIKSRDLAGIPKIFIVQACRGSEHSTIVPVVNAANKLLMRDAIMFKPAVVEMGVPEESEVVVFHSTYEGKYSYRHEIKGGPFIQILCTELNEHGMTSDINKIFTGVRKKVVDRKLQVPETRLTLTREFCFGDYFKEQKKKKKKKEDSPPAVVKQFVKPKPAVVPQYKPIPTQVFTPSAPSTAQSKAPPSGLFYSFPNRSFSTTPVKPREPYTSIFSSNSPTPKFQSSRSTTTPHRSSVPSFKSSGPSNPTPSSFKSYARRSYSASSSSETNKFYNEYKTTFSGKK